METTTVSLFDPIVIGHSLWKSQVEHGDYRGERGNEFITGIAGKLSELKPGVDFWADVLPSLQKPLKYTTKKMRRDFLINVVATQGNNATFQEDDDFFNDITDYCRTHEQSIENIQSCTLKQYREHITVTLNKSSTAINTDESPAVFHVRKNDKNTSSFYINLSDEIHKNNERITNLIDTLGLEDEKRNFFKPLDLRLSSLDVSKIKHFVQGRGQETGAKELTEKIFQTSELRDIPGVPADLSAQSYTVQLNLNRKDEVLLIPNKADRTPMENPKKIPLDVSLKTNPQAHKQIFLELGKFRTESKKTQNDLERAKSSYYEGSSLFAMRNFADASEPLEQAFNSKALLDNCPEESWASALMLGSIRYERGQAAEAIEPLEYAVTSKASKQFRDKYPLEWAQGTNLLGLARNANGDLEGAIEPTKNAVTSEVLRTQSPIEWIQSVSLLGIALDETGVVVDSESHGDKKKLYDALQKTESNSSATQYGVKVIQQKGDSFLSVTSASNKLERKIILDNDTLETAEKLQTKQKTEAIELLNQAVESEEFYNKYPYQSTLSLYVLGNLRYNRKEYAAAITSLEKVYSSKQDNALKVISEIAPVKIAHCAYLLGSARKAMGKHVEALEPIEYATASEQFAVTYPRESAQSAFLHGLLLYNSGKGAESIEPLKRAAASSHLEEELPLESAQSALLLGEALRRNMDGVKAIEPYKQAYSSAYLEKNRPLEWARSATWLAHFLNEKGDPAEAIKPLEKLEKSVIWKDFCAHYPNLSAQNAFLNRNLQRALRKPLAVRLQEAMQKASPTKVFKYFGRGNDANKRGGRGGGAAACNP